MKYIVYNIQNLILKHKLVFTTLILSILISSVVVYFSYDSFVQYSSKIQESKSVDEDSIELSFSKNSISYDELKKYCKSLSKEVTYNLEGALVSTNLEDQTYFFNFEIVNGVICFPEKYAYNMQLNALITSGSMYSKEQFSNGEKVVLTHNRLELKSGQKICLFGNEYKVIGTHNWGCDYILPITSLDDNNKNFLQELIMQFQIPINRKQYQEIKKNAKDIFGEKVKIPYMVTKDSQMLNYYYQLVAIIILISILASFNFAIIYKYILIERKNTLRIYRICGLSKRKAKLMYIIESQMIIIPIHLLGFCIYRFLIMSQLTKIWKYIKIYSDVKMYIVIFMIYVLLSAITIVIMLQPKIKNNVI